MDKKTEPFKLYKANKSNTGAALQLDLNTYKKSVFLDCAKQKDERIFDWGNKLTMKLSAQDISRILNVLENNLNTDKLFHQPSKGDYESTKNVKNNVLEISKSSYGYSFRISQQNTEGVDAITITVNDSEAILIKILLKHAILKIYGW